MIKRLEAYIISKEFHARTIGARQIVLLYSIEKQMDRQHNYCLDDAYDAVKGVLDDVLYDIEKENPYKVDALELEYQCSDAQDFIRSYILNVWLPAQKLIANETISAIPRKQERYGFE